mmetsp:Transcript_78080/g.91160  ORF Transcript_78080/g.91160 Transcript_78080/m.91160 type:complete len:175 (+) Transcript_78080:2-526(+)
MAQSGLNFSVSMFNPLPDVVPRDWPTSMEASGHRLGAGSRKRFVHFKLVERTYKSTWSTVEDGWVWMQSTNFRVHVIGDVPLQTVDIESWNVLNVFCGESGCGKTVTMVGSATKEEDSYCVVIGGFDDGRVYGIQQLKSFMSTQTDANIKKTANRRQRQQDRKPTPKSTSPETK